MFGLGVQELLLILLIAVFFFGGKQLPDLAKALGKGLREFKRASEGGADEEDEHEEPKKKIESHSGAAGAGKNGTFHRM